MLKSLLKTLSISAFLAWSGLSFAVGMGSINVTSSLGQPLKADIDLVAVTKAEKASLVARLASPDTYKNAGVDYPFNNKFRFEMVNRADGEPYLKVTSDQPVNDPFVVMMVELNWSAGRLVREFTFLLDPPNYVADQPAPINVQAVAPVAQAVPELAVVEPAAPVEVVPVEEAAAEPAMPEPAPVATKSVPKEIKPVPVETKPAPAKPTAASGRFDIATKPVAPVKEKAVAAGSYLVERGDTLAKIAANETPSTVSLERTLVALYRANADQFDGQNMNRLSVGKTLRLPNTAELAAVKQADAVTEIRAQAEDWNAYRQKLAGAAITGKQSSQATQQVATGKINSTVADKAPVAKESAKEVLKLSKGEAPGDKAASVAAGKKAAAQEQQNAAKEDEIAKAKALKEGQARAVALEKNLKDMEKLAQLKVEAAALAQKQTPAANEPKTVAAIAASAVAAAKDAKPMPKPKTKEVKAEPSLLDTVMSDPMYLAGGGAGLLGLLGLGWWVARRKKAPVFEDATDTSAVDIGSTTGRMAVPVESSPETGDFTQEITVQPQVEGHSEDVDPISEAELFLNFGRDAQAEDILKEALVNTPNNHQIHLKLLDIYAKRKDLASFETIARQLQSSGDESAFKQASDMGRGIDPRNTLYGGSEAIEDASSATMQVPSFAVSKPMEAVKPAEVDFDLDAEPTGKFTASPEHDFLDDTQKVAKESAVAGSEVEAAPNLDDLIFDVTGSHPAFDMGKPPVQPEVAKAADSMMEFTLDYPTEPVAKATPEIKAATVDFSGINLNLDSDVIADEALPPVQDEQWQEVATKLDLAKAYQEMGDDAGAREILEEVLREGDATQRETAQTLISQIS